MIWVPWRILSWSWSGTWTNPEQSLGNVKIVSTHPSIQCLLNPNSGVGLATDAGISQSNKAIKFPSLMEFLVREDGQKIFDIKKINNVMLGITKYYEAKQRRYENQKTVFKPEGENAWIRGLENRKSARLGAVIRSPVIEDKRVASRIRGNEPGATECLPSVSLFYLKRNFSQDLQER